MKKTIFFVLVMIFSLGTSAAFAANSELKSGKDRPVAPARTENKMSAEELSRLTRRSEDISNIDKSDMSGKEKRDLKKESKSIKNSVNRGGEVIYIGGTTLLLIIIILILL